MSGIKVVHFRYKGYKDIKYNCRSKNKGCYRKPEHDILRINDAMRVQSYFNVLRKAGPIFLNYISNIDSTSSMHRDKGK